MCIYFYPRSPCGERPIISSATSCRWLFLSTLSLRRATSATSIDTLTTIIFLSTLSLRRATFASAPGQYKPDNFYPRSPCGERPLAHFFISREQIFLSTLSLRRATGLGRLARPGLNISIHALLAESDDLYVCKTAKNGNFYPRSPCGERPCPRCSRGTLPKDFYPRSPCGERRKYMRCVLPVLISIHALLAESDATWYTSAPWMAFLSTLSLRRATAILAPLHNPDIVFLSTLSLRRATLRVLDGSKSSIISIHALLAESDILGVTVLGIQHNFYPRSPCGERLKF